MLHEGMIKLKGNESIEELELLLNKIDLQQKSTFDTLDKLTNERFGMIRKFSHILDLNSSIQLIESDSKQLDCSLQCALVKANQVSDKIEKLDMLSGRVNLALQRVEDMIDLKFCTDGVQDALQNEELDKAAAHIHRFLDLDETVLRMSTDASESRELEHSFSLLHDAQDKLKKMLFIQFQDASTTSDQNKIKKFFKLFPLLKLNQEGLNQLTNHMFKLLKEKYWNLIKDLIEIDVEDSSQSYWKFAQATKQLLSSMVS